MGRRTRPTRFMWGCCIEPSTDLMPSTWGAQGCACAPIRLVGAVLNASKWGWTSTPQSLDDAEGLNACVLTHRCHRAHTSLYMIDDDRTLRGWLVRMLPDTRLV